VLPDPKGIPAANVERHETQFQAERFNKLFKIKALAAVRRSC
jgi:hypothetical protein